MIVDNQIVQMIKYCRLKNSKIFPNKFLCNGNPRINRNFPCREEMTIFTRLLVPKYMYIKNSLTNFQITRAIHIVK